MAVTKRTRFEVLRRDNYTCRYCRSTDGALTVDHTYESWCDRRSLEREAEMLLESLAEEPA